jgi:NAD(P)-dependent dehydrogenase (short-subunit alcohol dehydrogenase family)
LRSQGIGRATSVAFVRHGITRIALLDIDAPGLLTTQDLLLNHKSNIEVLTVAADMASEESVVDGIGEVVQRFGSINIAVNNAGIGGPLRPSTQLSAKEFRNVLDINMVGLWVAQREKSNKCSNKRHKIKGKQVKFSVEFLPLSEYCSLERHNRGVIVNLSSTYGLIVPSASTSAAPYCTR